MYIDRCQKIEFSDGITDYVVCTGYCKFEYIPYTVILTIKEFIEISIEGKNIQKVVPKMSAADREFLISGISPLGWNNMHSYLPTVKFVDTYVDESERYNTKYYFNGYDANVKFQLSEALLNNSRIYALYKYYPKNRYPMLLNAFDNKNRETIWKFKDGGNSEEIANTISSAILNEKLLLDLCHTESTIFCIIPASSNKKNTLRFKNFANLVSKNIQVINGFTGIYNLYDREEYKGKKNINKTTNLGFSTNLFKGNNILLFDDITTTGTSYKQIMAVLYNLGAKAVYPIILGKTQL